MIKMPQMDRRATIAGLAAMICGVSKPAVAQFSLDLGNIINVIKGLNLGEDDEIRIGQDHFGAIVDASGGAYANRSVQSAIQRFSAPIFTTTTRSRFAWEIAVIDDDEINAWALPGGKIGVNKGLVRYCNSDHELAAAISHEMGHAELSHAISEMKKKTFMSSLKGAAQQAAVSEISGDAAIIADAGLSAAGGAIMEMVTSGYSRELEFEADDHIKSVFSRTGHDVHQGANFYQTLLQTVPKKSKGTTSLFAGHPQTQKRYDALLESAAAGFGAPNTSMGRSFAQLKAPFPTRQHYLRNPT